MQVSETEFEDRELAAALERSKAEAAQAGQAGTSSTSGPNPNLTVLPTDKFTEENVQALIKYGFSRDKVNKKRCKHEKKAEFKNPMSPRHSYRSFPV